MKRALYKTICLLMACIVLISSTGFGLLEHSCQMRGKKVELIGLHGNGCKGCPASASSATGDKPVIKKTDCCKEASRYENVDISSSLSQLFAKFIKAVTEAVTLAIVSIIAWMIDWIFDRDADSAALFAHAPPLAFGRTLLAIVQNFRL